MRTSGRRCLFGCIVLGSLAAVFLATAAVPRAGEPEPKNAPPKNLKLPGQIEAADQTDVYSRIVGFVGRVSVDIGDHVKKGQVLAELAVPEMEAELRRKEALVVQAEAEVEHAEQLLQESKATLAAATADVQQAEAAVKQAQATLEYAKATLERFKKLLDSKTIDATVVEEKAQQLNGARAALEEAQSKVQSAKATREGIAANRGALEAGVKVALARREAAKADRQHQAAMLSYAKITAPFDGVVTRRNASPGDLAGPPGSRGQRLFTVARIDTVRFVVNVPENDAPRLRTGSDAVVEVTAMPGHTYKGKLMRTSGAIDPKSRLLRAEIDLSNSDGKLLPGMSGTAGITLSAE
jgi:HlyD family secretion protein